MRFTRKWGWILLAVFLILTGLALVGLNFIPPIVTGIVAIAAGVLIFLER